MKLTKATISGLTLPTGKQDAIFFDEELRGFGLRVRSGGKRVWVVQFQVHGHQQRRVTIGRVELFSPEEARKSPARYLPRRGSGRTRSAKGRSPARRRGSLWVRSPRPISRPSGERCALGASAICRGICKSTGGPFMRCQSIRSDAVTSPPASANCCRRVVLVLQ